MVVGVVAGLILGALFTGGTPNDTSPDSTVVASPDAEPPPPTTTTTNVAPPARLATMVPGMLDSLVVTAIDRTGTSVVTVWDPAGQAPTPEALPWTRLRSDVSGTWLAGSTPNRWTDQRTLWVGNKAYMEPVSTLGGADFVWHPRLPGWLAWIDDSAGAPALTIAQFIPGRVANPQLVGEVSPETTVVWWNDLGIVTMEWIEAAAAVGQLQLRGNAGEVTHSIEIDFVLGTGRQVIAVQIDGKQVLLDQQLNVVAGVPWAGDCDQVEFGQHGFNALVMCYDLNTRRVEYWLDLVTDSEPVFQFPSANYADVGFRTDGVPYAFRVDPVRLATTIEFYMPLQGEVYEVAYPGRAMWIEAVRG
jgi:hypothetical protein